MKRYRFLLLAFFLVNNVHATSLTSGMAPAMNGARETDIKRTSPRNTAEIGNALEPVVSGSRTPDAQLNNSGNSARSAQATGTLKTSSKGMSCKTYEGKTYDQGEAGYSDCMRNIRTDRQGTRTVP